MSDFQRHKTIKTYIRLSKGAIDLSFDKKFLNNVKKMLKILRKYYPSPCLYIFNSQLNSYMSRYNLNIYAEQLAIPTC